MVWDSLGTMARKLRVEYPSAVYPVMNRGTGANLFSGMTRIGNGSSALWAVKWIAERLEMGAPGYVNHLLYLRRKTEGE